MMVGWIGFLDIFWLEIIQMIPQFLLNVNSISTSFKGVG